MTSDNKALDVVSSLRSIFPSAQPSNPIFLHEPDFSGTNAWKYVKDCIDTGWVSSAGGWVTRFEQEIVERTGASFAIAVTNGTVALRSALYAVGVRPGDEVIMPPLSFVATANAVAHLGATPHFVDIEASSLGLCPIRLSERLDSIAKIENGSIFNCLTGKKISAIIPVHVFGHPADCSSIIQIANHWNLPVVEDAAEALGSSRNSTCCGLFGNAGCLSFNGNKLITTGGGGAIITNNEELACRLRHITTTAKVRHKWEFVHDELGWNDRMPNINAALGVAHIENLSSYLSLKRNLALKYKMLFSSYDYVEIVDEPKDSESNYWLITLRLLDPDPIAAEYIRDKVLTVAHNHGICLRPVWNLLNELPMYTKCPASDLFVSQDQASRLISLPSSPHLLYD